MEVKERQPSYLNWLLKAAENQRPCLLKSLMCRSKSAQAGGLLCGGEPRDSLGGTLCRGSQRDQTRAQGAAVTEHHTGCSTARIRCLSALEAEVRAEGWFLSRAVRGELGPCLLAMGGHQDLLGFLT